MEDGTNHLDQSNDDAYCIRWNGSKGIDLPNVIRDLRDNAEMFDATLVCSLEDGGSASVQAHKLLLSAYSPVFRDMFKYKGDRLDPLVYVKGLSYHNLNAMLDFMYNGSVNISQAYLKSFLEEAEALQVRGLKTKGSTNSKQIIEATEELPKNNEKTNNKYKVKNIRKSILNESKNGSVKNELELDSLFDVPNENRINNSRRISRMKNESLVNLNPMDYIDEGICEDTEVHERKSFDYAVAYEVDTVETDRSTLLEDIPSIYDGTTNKVAGILENEETKEYQCTKCNYISTKRSNALRHIESQHKLQKSLEQIQDKCTKCGYRSSGKEVDSAGRNIGLKHHQCSEKPIKCIKCGFYTTRNDEWEAHAFNHLE